MTKSLLTLLLRQRHLSIWLTSALGGGAATLSFAPFYLPFLALLVPWPLFWFACRFRHSWRWQLYSGGVYSLLLTLFGFYWMFHTFEVFGGMSRTFSTLVFIPYALLLNLKIPLFILLFSLRYRRRFARYTMPGWFLAALAALLSDSVAPQIFPWFWGNLFAAHSSILQLAEVGGALLLTALLFAVSYLLYRIARIAPRLLRLQLRRRCAGSTTATRCGSGQVGRLAFATLPLLLTLIILGIGGQLREREIESASAEWPTLRIALLQPNTPMNQPGSPTLNFQSIGRIITETVPALAEEAAHAAESLGDGRKIELFLIPEASIPHYTTQENRFTREAGLYRTDFFEMATTITERFDAELLLNESTFGVATTDDGRQRLQVYNSATLFNRYGERSEVYHKRVLVAFGEYIPGLALLEKTGLLGLVPEPVRYSRFERGEESTLMAWRKSEQPGGEIVATGHFAPLICYEVVIGHHVRRFFSENRDKPIDFYVNLTQDGWYGPTIQTFQHFELGRLRSIETRRSLARAVNSGSSGAVTASGRYLEPAYGERFTAQESPAVQIVDLPLNHSGPTLYARFGESWQIVPWSIFVILVIVKELKYRRRHRK